MATLPVVDFGGFSSPSSTSDQRRAVAHQIDQACRSFGFFYLSNHGIPQSLLDDIRKLALDFFRNASAEEKQRIAIKPPAEGGDNARGYMKVTDAERGSHEVWEAAIWMMLSDPVGC